MIRDRENLFGSVLDCVVVLLRLFIFRELFLIVAQLHVRFR